MKEIPNEQLGLPELLPEQSKELPFDFQDMAEVTDEELEPTKMLLGDLVFPEEVTMLFGKGNVGKSILAIQWGQSISTGTNLDLGGGIVLANECEPMKVILYDFELSKKQVQKRYDKGYKFTNFDRATLKRSEYLGSDPLNVVQLLKAGAEKVGAKCIIIDNISAISGDIEKSSQAVTFMQSLMRLAKDDYYTIIVIAHTPKLKEYEPLSQEDIAGSNKINQLTDNAVAIGKVNSTNDNEYYIIHLKGRNGAITYHRNNVIHTAIEKIGGCVGHVALRLDEEYSLLREDISTTFERAPKRIFFTILFLYHDSNHRTAQKKLAEIGITESASTIYNNAIAFKDADSKKYKLWQSKNKDEQKALLDFHNPYPDFDFLPLAEGHVPKSNEDEIPF